MMHALISESYTVSMIFGNVDIVAEQCGWRIRLGYTEQFGRSDYPVRVISSYFLKWLCLFFLVHGFLILIYLIGFADFPKLV